MNDFTNATCLVTGGASGLGRAVCERLTGAGATVLLTDYNPAGQAVAEEIGAQFVQLDVSDNTQWQRMAAEIKELDYLHLNAGIQAAPPDSPLAEYAFEQVSLDNYRKMMGVNVDGVVFGLRNMLPVLKQGGAVVVTSSLAGITPYAVDPLYAMSKHAVSGLVRSVAGPLAKQGIRINALCPGGIDTNIIPHEQKTAAAEFMEPAHVAEEVLNLFTTEENGKTWAKVSTQKPAWIIRAPGDRG